MHYLILAGGNGSRLANDGVSIPKPLVELDGKPMIGRLIDIFDSLGAESITVVLNFTMEMVFDYLYEKQSYVGQLRIVPVSTTSPLISLALGSLAISPGEKIIAVTVDSVFQETEFAAFVTRFESSNTGALMGVTDFLDDEKALFLTVSPDGVVTGFHDNYPSCETSLLRVVSGGVYGLSVHARRQAEHLARERHDCRLRDFQRSLLRSGYSVEAFPLGTVVDVDRVTDLQTARKIFNRP